MKFVITLFTLLSFFAFTSHAQDKNPYKSIGKKGKVITLTQGKYEESFDDDSIQQINTALVNIHTMQVVKFELTKEEQRIIDETAVSRFLSVDPLTRSFSELSPYQYASNTPIQAIDLDGLEKFVVVDGPTPGTVVVQLQNYTKRSPEMNEEVVHGQPKATFLVEDLRKGATNANPYNFPQKSLQALFGGSFIILNPAWFISWVTQVMQMSQIRS